MKVLLVGLSCRGAMGDNLVTLAKHLSYLCPTAVLAGLEDVAASLLQSVKVDYVEYTKTRPYEYLSISKARRAISFIRSFKPDVVHFVTPHPINPLLSLVSSSLPQVYTWHDPVQHKGTNSLFRAVYSLHDAYMVQRCDRVIVACESLKRYCEAVTGKQKYACIPLGLLEMRSTPGFCCSSDDSLNQRVPGVDVLFFGRLEYYKGIDVLLKALHFLQRDSVNVSAAIVGPGRLRNLPNVLHVLPGLKNVSVREGWVSYQELHKWISKAKIVVLPYRDATGTQTVQLCYYHRKPVVASRVGCFVDYVIDGKTGVLVPPEDPSALAEAIRSLLDDATLRQQMGIMGERLLSSIFNMSRIAEMHYELYAEVVRK